MQIKSERKVSLFEQCAKSKVRADGQDELLKSHTEAQRFFKKKYSPLCYEDFHIVQLPRLLNQGVNALRGQ